MLKNIQGPCSHCGMPLEFRADAIGTMAQCPYCRKQTLLQLGVPRLESGIPKKALVWTTVAILVCILGLAGAFYALQRAQGLATGRSGAARIDTNTGTNSAPGVAR